LRLAVHSRGIRRLNEHVEDGNLISHDPVGKALPIALVERVISFDACHNLARPKAVMDNFLRERTFGFKASANALWDLDDDRTINLIGKRVDKEHAPPFSKDLEAL
jgi:hypothetical protein